MTDNLVSPYWEPDRFTLTVGDPGGPGNLTIGVTIDERVPRGIALLVGEDGAHAVPVRDITIRWRDHPPVSPDAGNPWAELRDAAAAAIGPVDYKSWRRLMQALQGVRDLPAPGLAEDSAAGSTREKVENAWFIGQFDEITDALAQRCTDPVVNDGYRLLFALQARVHDLEQTAGRD